MRSHSYLFRVFIGVDRRSSAVQLPFLGLLVFLLLWATAVRACPGDADERLPPADKLGTLERGLGQRAGEGGGGPAALRARLERRLNAIDVLRRQDALTGFSSWSKQAATGWEGAGSLTFKVGRGSNLHTAPANNVLTLTLPEGEALLLLADRFRPRAGSAAVLDATGQPVR